MELNVHLAQTARHHPPATTRLTREQTRAATVSRLVAAAARVVAQQGFGGATVDEIAEAAGFSRGAFYSNFASKELLLLELLRRHMVAEIAGVKGVLRQASDAKALIVRLEQWAQAYHEDADWALLAAELQLHAQRSSTFAGPYEAVQTEHRQALGEVLSVLFAGLGKQLPMPADTLARVFKALAQGLALQSAAARSAAPASQRLGPLREVLRALIQSASPLDPPLPAEPSSKI